MHCPHLYWIKTVWYFAVSSSYANHCVNSKICYMYFMLYLVWNSFFFEKGLEWIKVQYNIWFVWTVCGVFWNKSLYNILYALLIGSSIIILMVSSWCIAFIVYMYVFLYDWLSWCGYGTIASISWMSFCYAFSDIKASEREVCNFCSQVDCRTWKLGYVLSFMWMIFTKNVFIT